MAQQANRDIDAQAQAWAVALSAEDVDQSVIDAFRAWHQRSPHHAKAFIRADRVWQSMAGLDHLRAHAQAPAPTRAKSTARTPSWLTPLMAWIQQLGTPTYAAWSVVFVAIMSLFMLAEQRSSHPEPLLVENYRTAQGEVKTIALEDGSTLTLGAQTRLQVRYQANERRIDLAQGEALFDVTHNPHRPFIVITAGAETRVLGTVFAVERRSDSVSVSVREGRVRVGSPLSSTPNDEAPILGSGQKVRADLKGQTGDIQTVAVENIGAWQQGRLVFENTPLTSIIADANRYFDKRIILVNATQANTRLSLSLSLDDLEGFVEDLAALLDMKVTLSGNAILLAPQ